MSTGVGTIAVRAGRGRRRWLMRLVISVVAITVAALAVAAILSLTAEEPVTGQPSVTLPRFEGGPIYTGGQEGKPPGYGATFQEAVVDIPAPAYGRTFQETLHQRG